MVNSSYKIFCLYKRLPDIFTKMNFDLYPNLDKPVVKSWFDHTNPFIKKQCYRLFNEIENSYYNFHDLTSYLIYRSLWDKAVSLSKANGDSLDDFKKKFTEKQLKKDREVMRGINEKAKFRHISEYFTVRENGESLIYRLCMDEVLSVYFFVYYANNSLTGFFGRAKLKERSERYAKFVNTTDILAERMSLPTYQSTLPETE
jgi:hypothetical protein